MSQKTVSVALSGLTLVGLGVLAKGGYDVMEKKKKRTLEEAQSKQQQQPPQAGDPLPGQVSCIMLLCNNSNVFSPLIVDERCFHTSGTAA